MDADARFLWVALALQIVFSVAVTALVARRWPARARAYRLIAPAALPLLLLLLAGYALWGLRVAQGLRVDLASLGRMLLAYAVLWLIGVLAAGIVLRRFRR